MGKAAPLAVYLVFPGAKNLDGEHSPSSATNTRDPGGEQTIPKNLPMSHILETQVGNTVPPVALVPLTPPKQIHVGSTALLVEGTQNETAALPVPSSTRDAERTQ